MGNRRVIGKRLRSIRQSMEPQEPFCLNTALLKAAIQQRETYSVLNEVYNIGICCLGFLVVVLISMLVSMTLYNHWPVIVAATWFTVKIAFITRCL